MSENDSQRPQDAGNAGDTQLGIAGVARILGTLGIVLAHGCDPFVK